MDFFQRSHREKAKLQMKAKLRLASAEDGRAEDAETQVAARRGFFSAA
jgi:hypothetical protein